MHLLVERRPSGGRIDLEDNVRPMMSSAVSSFDPPDPIRAAEIRKSMELVSLQIVIQLLFPSTIRVLDFEILEGHIHPLRVLRLSNDMQLVLKRSPRSTTRILRQETNTLETEALVLSLLSQRANPCFPQLFKFDPQGTNLGTPYLIRSHVPGHTLREIESDLDAEERQDVSRHLGFLARTIGQCTSPYFGPVDKVALGYRCASWRQAFLELFESTLQDAEDMFLSIPYTQIRQELFRLAGALDEVRLGRLVIVDFGKKSHVLLDPRVKKISGLIDFGHAIWGDVLMLELFENPSPTFLDGYGAHLSGEKSERTRQLMYACYRSVHKIVGQYYRQRIDEDELNARKGLTSALAEMATLES